MNTIDSAVREKAQKEALLKQKEAELSEEEKNLSQIKRNITEKELEIKRKLEEMNRLLDMHRHNEKASEEKRAKLQTEIRNIRSELDKIKEAARNLAS